MKQYIRNILIYLAALFCIVSFMALFTHSLDIYDEFKGSWSSYKVNVYLGEKVSNKVIYNGTVLPIFGFVFPLIISIILIVESFKKSWSGYLKGLNTILSVVLVISFLLVLLTKELFLSSNNLGETTLIKNGTGPILSAVTSLIGAILLVLATWIPFKSEIKFIDRQ